MKGKMMDNPCEGCYWQSHLPNYFCSQNPSECRDYAHYQDYLEGQAERGEVDKDTPEGR